MGYGFKVRRIRSRSERSMPSETYYYRRWKIHEERKSKIKSYSSTTRALMFVFFCSLVNVLGILISDFSPYSNLYLDSIGTAMAAMAGGLGIGALVVFFSSVFGVLYTGQAEYALFAYGNVVCVFLWTYFPRSGRRALGADIFEKRTIYGYRHFISRIFFLGFVTAAVSTFSSSIFQFYFIDGKIENNILNLRSSFGTVASQNSLMTVSNALRDANILSSDFSISLFYYIVASLPVNFVDKTLSILLAIVAIIVLFDPPNYRNQRDRIIDRPSSDSQWWNRRYIYLFVVSGFTAFAIASSRDAVLNTFLLIALGVLLLMIFMAEPHGCRSVDPYRVHGYRKPLFVGSSDSKIDIPYFKDGVEDTLKILTFLYVVMQFSSNILFGKIDGLIVHDSRAMLNMLWYTVILLTGIRYALMASLRSLERI